jgi:uncharacterized membrane protein YvbJ
MSPPETCPNCGAEVPADAKACPECGSDYETGWSEHAQSQNLGLPDEEFDYGRFVKEEFENPKSYSSGLHWFWWIVAAILLILLAVYLF